MEKVFADPASTTRLPSLLAKRTNEIYGTQFTMTQAKNFLQINPLLLASYCCTTSSYPRYYAGFLKNAYRPTFYLQRSNTNSPTLKK